MTSPSFQLPGEFLEAIKTRPQLEIERIFEGLTQKKLAEIPGCQTTEDLIKIQAQAKYCMELQQFFLSEMKRK